MADNQIGTLQRIEVITHRRWVDAQQDAQFFVRTRSLQEQREYLQTPFIAENFIQKRERPKGRMSVHKEKRRRRCRPHGYHSKHDGRRQE